MNTWMDKWQTGRYEMRPKTKKIFLICALLFIGLVYLPFIAAFVPGVDLFDVSPWREITAIFFPFASVIVGILAAVVVLCIRPWGWKILFVALHLMALFLSFPALQRYQTTAQTLPFFLPHILILLIYLGALYFTFAGRKHGRPQRIE